MSTVASRTFLGYEAGFLTRAARALLELPREALRESVVVVPGRRAGRKLLEALVREAGGALEPPRIVTEAGLAPALSRRALALASQPLSECAWFEVLRGASPAELAPFGRAARTVPERWALARSLAAQDRELAALGGAARPEAAALAALSVRARGLLEGAGFTDAARALESVGPPSARREGVQVVLVGMVELAPPLAELLAALEPRPRALIQAPPEDAASFDALGALDVEAWEARRIPLADGDWRSVDGPAEAEAAALEWLAGLPRGTATDQVVLGVPGDALLPGLARALAGAGLELHPAAGVPLRTSAPWLALDALRAWLEREDFAALAALARHPALETWLEKDAGSVGAAPAALDAWHAEHLPDGVGGELAGGADHAVGRLRARVRELAGELALRERRPLAAWSAGIAALFAKLHPELPADEAGGGADSRTREALERFARLSAVLAEGAALLPAEPIDAAQALALWLDWSAEEPLRPPQRPGAIETLGWLELALEDAPWLLLSGLVEGWVPRALRAGPLADGAAVERRARARLARDVHALTAIALRRVAGSGRAGFRALTLRHGPEGEPLRPSRLLFHVDDASAVARAELTLARSDRTPAAAEPEQGAVRGPAALPLFAPGEIASVRVSDLEVFVRSPYQFYLERVERLERVRDDAWELDPRCYGTLVHDVLEAFGRGAARGETEPQRIREFVLDTLGSLARERFGPSPLPAVRLQIQQLERRLAAFAPRQAELARDGWRIEEVEVALEGAALTVGGARVAIAGRIDRIDRKGERGLWRILDYKTGDDGTDPVKSHLRGGRWVDFQLPLYRHFLRARLAGEIEVGYFALPRKLEDCGVQLAPFTQDQHDEALAEAHRVIGEIRQGAFARVGRARPTDRVQRALYGLSLLELGDAGSEEELSEDEVAP